MNKLVCHKLAFIDFLQKPTRFFYNNQSLQQAFGYSWSTSANCYVTLLTLLHTECCIPAFYLFVRHRYRPHKEFFCKKFFHLTIVWLWSYWVPILKVSSSILTTAALFYSMILAKNVLCCPAVSWSDFKS